MTDITVNEETRRPFEINREKILFAGCSAIVALTAVSAACIMANERWLLMWATTIAFGIALKLFIFFKVSPQERAARPWTVYIWFLAWPGMDGGRFFHESSGPTRPSQFQVWTAAAKTVIGIAFVWGGARLFYPEHAIGAGWIGMIGIVLLLHFGIFDLLSILWRTLGIEAEPIMRSPLRSSSLGEFWGKRWNTGFSIPAGRFLLRPLARRYGANTATLTIFLLSGLLHELVITVPARGGYGLPTGYFILQGIGTLWQNSRRARAWRLNRSKSGRLFTILFAALPAFWLFPPVFVHNVILPMLRAIGAIGGEYVQH
jgi:hypothetical protein